MSIIIFLYFQHNTPFKVLLSGEAPAAISSSNAADFPLVKVALRFHEIEL